MKNKTLLIGLTAVLLTLFACSKSNTNAATTDAVVDQAKTTVKEKVIDTAKDAVTAAGEVENYALDIRGAHAFVMFKVKHLGYSWLHGRFNNFDGEFSYDTGNPNNSEISVSIDTTSVDSNHAERDKHLRGAGFLNVEEYPSASFVSTSMNLVDGKGTVTGDFTLLGVTKEIVINVEEVGHGDDPWGGYRRGFTGTTSFTMADYGVKKNLGPASTDVYLELNIEGIRQ